MVNAKLDKAKTLYARYNKAVREAIVTNSVSSFEVGVKDATTAFVGGEGTDPEAIAALTEMATATSKGALAKYLASSDLTDLAEVADSRKYLYTPLQGYAIVVADEQEIVVSPSATRMDRSKQALEKIMGA